MCEGGGGGGCRRGTASVGNGVGNNNNNNNNAAAGGGNNNNNNNVGNAALAWAPGAPAADVDDEGDWAVEESEEFVEATPPGKRPKRW